MDKSREIILVGRISRKLADFISLLKHHGFRLVASEISRDFPCAMTFALAPKIDSKKKSRGKVNTCIIPLDDDDVTTCCQIRADWFPETGFVAGPDIRRHRFFADKLKFQRWAAFRKFPVAPSEHGWQSSVDGYFVIKPRVGSGSRGVKILKTSGDAVPKGYMRQQYIEHPLEPFGISGFANDGKILALFGHRRVLTRRSFGGVSLIAKELDIGFSRVTITNLILEMRWSGFFMVECLGDESEWKIIEFNTRLWGSFRLGMSRVLNLPDLLFGDEVIVDEQQGNYTYVYWLSFFVRPLRTIAFLKRLQIADIRHITWSPSLSIQFLKLYMLVLKRELIS